MRAIVKVNKNSAFSHLNGLTFDVKEVLSNIISLDVDGITVDFSFKEVMIVDIQQESQRLYDLCNWYGNIDMLVKFNKLNDYKEQNKIKFELVYNCPS